MRRIDRSRGIGLRGARIGQARGDDDHFRHRRLGACNRRRREGHRPLLSRRRRCASVVGLRDQVRSVAAAGQRQVDAAPQGERHGRLLRRHPVSAARARRSRRLRDRRQQHGTRRRRIAELDRRPSGESQGLGPARALLRHDRSQSAQRRVLRQAGQVLVLRRLLQRRAAGDDDGAELSGAFRRHRCRRAVDVLPGPAVLAALDRASSRFQLPAKPPVLSDAKRAQITQRVLAACDGLDGLVDGQITNPRACKFDIETIGPAGDKTLTAEELAVVKAMYAGTTTESGVRRSPGAKLGSEADWMPLFADNGGYGAFIEHFVYSRNTPNFDWRRALDFSKTLRRGESRADARYRGPQPGHLGIRRARRQAGSLPRLERRRRAAGRVDRISLRAHAIRAAAQSSQGETSIARSTS